MKFSIEVKRPQIAKELMWDTIDESDSLLWTPELKKLLSINRSYRDWKKDNEAKEVNIPQNIVNDLNSLITFRIDFSD